VFVGSVQLPELASGNVRMKDPDRVSAIIRGMIASGSQRLQVFFLFFILVIFSYAGVPLILKFLKMLKFFLALRCPE